MQCMEVWGGNGVSDNGVTMPGIDAWVLSRPYKGDAQGGDIHYVSSCGTGRISRILVADVAGHGEHVAGLAVMLRNLMRRYVNFVDQTRFVEMMNREFAVRSDAGRFATAVVATYWAPTDYLVACNAGHPRPLAFSARHRSWQLLDSETVGEKANVPLGVIEDARYEQFAVRMRPGDLVVIYTDSLMESRRPDGSQIGESGILDIARTLDVQDAPSLARRLVDAVVAACGGREPDDDVTVMVVRPNGLRPKETFAARLKTQMRFVGRFIGSWRRGAGPVPWPEVSLENLLGPFSKRANQRLGRDARELPGAQPPSGGGAG